MVAMFFQEGIDNPVSVVGITCWIVSALIGIGFLINHIVEKRRFKEHKPTMLGAFIKAKKEKYCPKINWTE